MSWKIGEIIKKTGLTARALHFYEQKELIGPITRNAAGHRCYTQADLIRLQQIRSLRMLGVQINDMPPLLHDDVTILSNQLKQQLAQLRKKREAILQLEDKTQRLLSRLESQSILPEQLDQFLFQTLESLTMYDQYFTQDDIDQMHQHTHDDAQSTETTWNKWVDALKMLMKSGEDPQSDKVNDMMNHWNEMINHLCNGDSERLQAFNDLLHNETQARRDHGLDDDVFEFMGKALGGHKN